MLIDHPPHSSRPCPGFGSDTEPHNRDCAGCSSTPPHLRICCTDHTAYSLSPGGGFAKCASLPHARHGGCAITGFPPPHFVASRCASHKSHPGSVLYIESCRTKSTETGHNKSVEQTAGVPVCQEVSGVLIIMWFSRRCSLRCWHSLAFRPDRTVRESAH